MLTKLEQISGMASISLFSLAAIPSPTAEKRKEKGNPGQKERKVIVVGGLAVGQLLSLQERRRWMMLADGLG